MSGNKQECGKRSAQVKEILNKASYVNEKH